MTPAHASLSPSSAERWISCPASVRLIAETYPDGVPDSDSPWAAEGTHAHTVAEMLAGLALLGKGDRTGPWMQAETVRNRICDAVGAESYREMMSHGDDYVDLLRDIIDGDPAHVMLEARFETGIPGCWGTSDAVILKSDSLHVVDFKYGRGVPVSAEGNPQLRLYALGAARTLADLGSFTEVSYTVHQPRLSSVSTETTTVAELEHWAATVVEPAAAEALEGSDRFGPSEAACRFCPMSGQCRAQRDAAVVADFGRPPPTLSAVEIGLELDRLGQIEQWCKSLRETALTLIYEAGVSVPGWKVVRSGGRRGIVDTEAAVAKLEAAGYSSAETTRRGLQTVGTLDRLVGGRKILDEILGDLVQTSEGRESLAPEDDKRSAVTRTADATQDFA